MAVKLIPHGNTLAVPLPIEAVKRLKLKQGQYVTVMDEQRWLRVRPISRALQPSVVEVEEPLQRENSMQDPDEPPQGNPIHYRLLFGEGKEMRLSTAIEMHLKSGLDSLIVISIPLTSGLTDFSFDFFPPYFRGWCSSSIHQIPETIGIHEVELDEYFKDLDTDIWFSRANFMIENCPMETVEQFAREYETRTNCKPSDEDELIVFNISLKTDATTSQQGINTSVQSAAPELPLQHQTNA